MTKKLYDSDSHLTEADAVVLSCAPVEGGFAVVLDQTPFFPTGGGQPCDLGTIGNARVLDCREREGTVVHVTDAPLDAGAAVRARIDWRRRFDFMQQHTGEHLLSFAAYKLFGAANVGFHLADAYTTIDFDRPLDHAQLTDAEALANSFVWRNLPVTATLYESEADIRDLPLRKHAEGLTAPIRIVRVEDADCCTCCAPHCAYTGEIGQIFITDAVAYKGGTRVTFLCGGRALRQNRATHDAMDRIARRFSSGREGAEGAVNKLSDEYATARRQERALAAALNGYMAAELKAGAAQAGGYAFVAALVENVDPSRLKDLAQAVAGPRTLAALFSGQDGRLAYVLAAGEGFPTDVSELMPAVNAAVAGKGGGRGTLAQGMARTTAGAGEAVEQVRRYFVTRYAK